MPFNVDRLDHIVLNVRDVDSAATWYQRVLGMRREEFGTPRRTALKFGNQKINLRPAGADPAQWVTGPNDQPGAGDLCFIATPTPAQVMAHLRDCGVAILEGPVQREGALGPMQSVYCRDPDGNLVEIATYPPP
jgi:catechol 2,3-dioxygenase-like lactoylglutathione lyase family enzyme